MVASLLLVALPMACAVEPVVKGGQYIAQVPEHADLVDVSEANMYNVLPEPSVRNVPAGPLCVCTVAAAEDAPTPDDPALDDPGPADDAPADDPVPADDPAPPGGVLDVVELAHALSSNAAAVNGTTSPISGRVSNVFTAFI